MNNLFERALKPNDALISKVLGKYKWYYSRFYASYATREATYHVNLLPTWKGMIDTKLSALEITVHVIPSGSSGILERTVENVLQKWSLDLPYSIAFYNSNYEKPTELSMFRFPFIQHNKLEITHSENASLLKKICGHLGMELEKEDPLTVKDVQASKAISLESKAEAFLESLQSDDRPTLTTGWSSGYALIAVHDSKKVSPKKRRFSLNLKASTPHSIFYQGKIPMKVVDRMQHFLERLYGLDMAENLWRKA